MQSESNPEVNNLSVDIPVLKCVRCGHTWTPRVKNVLTCPKCRSPYWNTPKK